MRAVTSRLVERDRAVARLDRASSPLDFASAAAPGASRRVGQMFGMLPLQSLVDDAGRQLPDLMADLFDLRKADLVGDPLFAESLLSDQIRQRLQLPTHGRGPALVRPMSFLGHRIDSSRGLAVIHPSTAGRLPTATQFRQHETR